jgi:predicted DNA-binding transcriptional regulator AlpA
MSRRPQPTPPPAATRPVGVFKLADVPGLQAAADIEPLLRVADLTRVLNCSRRVVERMRAAGRLPSPDLHIGKMPRWRPETIRAWIEKGGGR